jgi:hypothetical protein
VVSTTKIATKTSGTVVSTTITAVSGGSTVGAKISAGQSTTSSTNAGVLNSSGIKKENAVLVVVAVLIAQL